MAVGAFVRAGHGRRVAIRSLRGPRITIAYAADEVVPAASLIKVPLAAAVWDAANDPSHHLDLTTLVACGELGVTSYPSIMQVFSPDRMVSIAELVKIMLSTSDNPVSQYLLELVHPEAVNAAAARLGAKDTTMAVGFTDDLFGEAGRSNITTANDMVNIFASLFSNPSYQPLLKAMRNNMRNTRIPLRLPDDLHVSHKTGSLTGLVNDAGIVYGTDIDLAMAFLADGQIDGAATSTAIGDCVATIWSSVGESI